VRLKPRPGQRGRQDNWLLIKGHDEAERAGADAPAIEQAAPPPKPVGKKAGKRREGAPAEGAVRAKLPQRQAPQLASPAEEPRTAKPGSARSSSTGIACCAGSITATCAL